MAYYGQKNSVMPDERSLLMPFSVRHLSEDDKLCHHMNLDVLQEIYWGRRVVAIDGTNEDVAETPANANYFGRITQGPSKSPFPHLRALYLQECTTDAIFDAVTAACRVAQARLAPRQDATFPVSLELR